MNVSSPCVKVCQLDKQGVCIGCLRTRDEIARWIQMMEREKSLVIATLKHRKTAAQLVNPLVSAE